MRLDVETNGIVQGDCVQLMQALPESCIDLVFADPPFNIGYEYDVYHDKKERRDYLEWSRSWISAVYRALKTTGSFWLAIGDEYAAELKLASQEIGFRPRSWVIWYYTFGVNCKQKFSRSHAHLLYFVKDSKTFTFRANELENRIPSARQLVYADHRANPEGRLPDDTWVLRPQDLADCFTPDEDTWYFPRVAGTFKERAGFHGCQMPEQLLGRIIRTCSNPGDRVLDPFSGSATTAVVAKKLARAYIAFELSKEYVDRGRARLESVCLGDTLDGAAEPTVSAPATPKQNGQRRGKSTSATSLPTAAISPRQLKLYQQALLSAYRDTYDGYSLDRVVADPEINSRFTAACAGLGLPGEPRTWNWSLFRLRKAGVFAELPGTRRTEFAWEECDKYLFASEIAWRRMIDVGCESLDAILCDPALARQFDEIAMRWAPGFSPLEYRWAALKLRKSARLVRSRAELLEDARLSRPIPLESANYDDFPDQPGVYVVFRSNSEALYAGEATRLRERVRKQLRTGVKLDWRDFAESLSARFFTTTCPYSTRLAYQRQLISRHRPPFNLPDKKIA